MELDHLYVFFTVARELSFSGAAKVLRVQQPAVSRTIQKLESSLEVRLFERNKRSVRLTADGAEIFSICKRAFGELDRIRQFVSSKDQVLRGELRFGVSDAVATYLVPDVLIRYHADHPLVRPSIFSGTSTAISEQVLKNDLEFGIFFTQPSSQLFDVVEIGKIPFYLVGTRAFAKRKDKFRCLIASRENEYRGERSFPVKEMLAREGIEPETIISTNNLEAQKEMVLRGLGIGLLPAFMLRREIARRQLVLLADKSRFTFSLKRVTRCGKLLSRQAETFLRSLNFPVP